VLIRMPVRQISLLGRPSRGVRVMKTGERVVTMVHVPASDEEIAIDTDQDGDNNETGENT